MFRNFCHDHDDGAGWLVGVAVVLVIVGMIIAAIIYFWMFLVGAAAFVGAIYGGFNAIKNYGASFKENVIDSNRATT